MGNIKMIEDLLKIVSGEGEGVGERIESNIREISNRVRLEESVSVLRKRREREKKEGEKGEKEKEKERNLSEGGDSLLRRKFC